MKNCKHEWLKIEWESDYNGFLTKNKIKGIYYVCGNCNKEKGAVPIFLR